MSTTYNTLTVKNGVKIFYRESGSKSNPTLLLLHGFPTSSRLFKNLIPLLNQRFHLIAPDLPGFGKTELPKEFTPTFENIAESVEFLLDELTISKFGIYVFDYGAPTGFRLALNPKFTITAIYSQNGNAYEEGLGGFWDPLKLCWELMEKSPQSSEDKHQLDAIQTELIKNFTDYEPYHQQYYSGEDENIVDPEGPIIDQKLLKDLPNYIQHQLGLFMDYRNNIKKYPEFQQFFAESNVPILAIWGINDTIFPKPGQEAYKKHSKNVKLVDINGGHFAGYVHTAEIADNIISFSEEYNII